MNSARFILAVALTLATLLAAGLLAAWLTRDRTPLPAVDSERGPTPTADWPMFRGDAGLAGMAAGSLPEALKLAWTFKTADAVKSSPIIAAGCVYVGSDDGRVYALDLRSGRQRWSFDAGQSIEAPPLHHQGLIYVGSAGGTFHALDAASGRLRWRFDAQDKILASAGLVAAPRTGPPLVLVGSYDHSLYALDAASGDLAWSYQTGSFINGAPAVGDGWAAVGGCDNLVHLVRLDDGTALATVELEGPIAGSVAVADGVIYTGHYANAVVAIDARQPQVAWTYRDRPVPFFAAPALTADLVVIGGRDRRLHAIDRHTGRPRWHFQTRGKVDSSAVVCGDKLVVGSDDGRLYMLRLADGAPVWSYEIGAAITASPAVGAGHVVIAAHDGVVYAFTPDSSR